MKTLTIPKDDTEQKFADTIKAMTDKQFEAATCKGASLALPIAYHDKFHTSVFFDFAAEQMLRVTTAETYSNDGGRSVQTDITPFATLEQRPQGRAYLQAAKAAFLAKASL